MDQREAMDDLLARLADPDRLARLADPKGFALKPIRPMPDSPAPKRRRTEILREKNLWESSAESGPKEIRFSPYPSVQTSSILPTEDSGSNSSRLEPLARV